MHTEFLSENLTCRLLGISTHERGYY